MLFLNMTIISLIKVLCSVLWIQIVIASDSRGAFLNLDLGDVPQNVLDSGILDDTAVFGYAFEYSIDPKKIPWGSLTHLILAFLNVDSAGNASFSNKDHLQSVVKTAHTKNVKVLASVGGSGVGSTAMASALSTNATRANLAMSLADITDQYNLDGVDYDFEFPENINQIQNLYQGLLDMRSAFDSKFSKGSKMLTMTLYSSKGQLGPNVPKVDAKPFSDIVNYGLLMSYDFFGSFSEITAPNSPFFDVPGYPGLSFTSSISAWLGAGWAPEKLVAGLPYYGRTATMQAGILPTTQFMPNSGAAPPGGPVSKIPGAWTWLDLRDPNDGALRTPAVSQNGWQRFWDSTTATPWLFHNVSGTYIGYDDIDSLTIKTNHIITKGLAGAMVWMVPYDYMNELTAVMQNYTSVCKHIAKQASLSESQDSSDSDSAETDKDGGTTTDSKTKDNQSTANTSTHGSAPGMSSIGVHCYHSSKLYSIALLCTISILFL